MEGRAEMIADGADALLAFRSGNRKAFDAFYKAYAPRFFAYILSFTQDVQVAEDLLQDFFLRLQKIKLPEDISRGKGDLQSYLFRSLRNLCADHFRSRSLEKGKLRDYVYRFQDFSRNTTGDGGDEQLSKALASLDFQRREVIVMYHYSGLTFQAISESLGFPLQTIYSRYKCGLDDLKGLLHES